MRLLIAVLTILFFHMNCMVTSIQLEVANDPNYGYPEENPVQVAGGYESGPQNQRDYLSLLCIPGSSEKINFERLGSCCSFEDPSQPLGSGLLDMYEITHPNLDEPIVLYLDMYREDMLFIPEGFVSCN